MPRYYVGEAFIRLISFKDYIKMKAKAVVEYKDLLSGDKVTNVTYFCKTGYPGRCVKAYIC